MSISAAVVSRLFASWKVPKLSSVPAGIAAGLIVTVMPWPGWTGMDTACEKPGGVGSEEQKLPAVTRAGMPAFSRSPWCSTYINPAGLAEVEHNP